MATFVWTAAVAGNWSTGANWSVAGVPQAAPPTAADDVLFGSGVGATNSNCTITAASVCRSMIDTGYTGTKSGSGDLTVGDGSGGAVTLAAGATYSGTWTMKFAATSDNAGAGWPVTSNGKTFPGTILVAGVGGKWTCQDAPTWTSKLVTITDGIFVAQNFTFTWGTLTGTGANLRTIDFTGSTVTLNAGAAGTAFNTAVTTNLTFLSPTTLILTANGTALNPGGVTFTNLSLTGTGTYGFNSSCIITGTLTRSNAAACGMRGQVGITVQYATLVASGTSGNLVSINCVTAGSRWILKKTSGAPTNIDFVSIKDTDAEGVIPLYAGANSTDGGNNVNVVFYANPNIPPQPGGDRAGMSRIGRKRSSRLERLFNTKVPYYSQHKGR